ncbi:hypothetical protein [Streptomyces sp. NPDC046862]|uniref:hypothetical protein n=1 Tax=Streptomyces sp. NPDC046862 TaxID=3154603 RepID=UPI003453643C
MPLLRRADWPRDHRDEVVAGALVGAVVIVLGYASGIGAPSASGADKTAAPPASPPAAMAPVHPAPAPAEPEAQVPVGQVPGGAGELPVLGGGTGERTGHGSGADEGHAGHGSGGGSATAPGSSPSPSPSGSPGGEPPAGGDTCEDGEVRLVTPLLTGLTRPLFEVVNGTGETPSPEASPCVGLAPVDGLLGISPSPLPEVTP